LKLIAQETKSETERSLPSSELQNSANQTNKFSHQTQRAEFCKIKLTNCVE